jgi:hypothetical protein
MVVLVVLAKPAGFTDAHLLGLGHTYASQNFSLQLHVSKEFHADELHCSCSATCR